MSPATYVHRPDPEIVDGDCLPLDVVHTVVQRMARRHQLFEKCWLWSPLTLAKFRRGLEKKHSEAIRFSLDGNELLFFQKPIATKRYTKFTKNYVFNGKRLDIRVLLRTLARLEARIVAGDTQFTEHDKRLESPPVERLRPAIPPHRKRFMGRITARIQR